MDPTFVASGYYEKLISGTPNNNVLELFFEVFYVEEIIFKFSRTTQLNL